jgi:hypothetical protein
MTSTHHAPGHGEIFDVFLCYNSKDLAEVRQIFEALRRRGIRPWFDREHMPPGQTIPESLEDAIDRCPTAAVLVGRHGIGPWGNVERQAILMKFARRKPRKNQKGQKGRPITVIPVLMQGAKKEPRLPTFLTEFSWVDLRSGMRLKEIDRLVWAITGERPLRVTAQVRVTGLNHGRQGAKSREMPNPNRMDRDKTAEEIFAEYLDPKDNNNFFSSPQEVLKFLLSPFPRQPELTLAGALFRELTHQEPLRSLLWIILEASGPLFKGPQKEGSLRALPFFRDMVEDVNSKLDPLLKDWTDFVTTRRLLPLSRLMALVREGIRFGRGPTFFTVVFEPAHSRLPGLRASRPFEGKNLALLYRMGSARKRICMLEIKGAPKIRVDDVFGRKDTPPTSLSPLFDELSQYKFGSQEIAFYVGCDLKSVGDTGKLYVAFSEKADLASAVPSLDLFSSKFFLLFGERINRRVVSEGYSRFIQQNPLDHGASIGPFLANWRIHDPENAFNVRIHLPPSEEAMLQFEKFNGEDDFEILRSDQGAPLAPTNAALKDTSSSRGTSSSDLRNRLRIAKLVALAKRYKMLTLFDLLHYACSRKQTVIIARQNGGRRAAISDPWKLLELLHASKLVSSQYAFSTAWADDSPPLLRLGEFLEEIDNGSAMGIEHLLELAADGFVRYKLSLAVGPAGYHDKAFPNFGELLPPTFNIWLERDKGIPPVQTARRTVRAIARFFGSGSGEPQVTIQMSDSALDGSGDGVNLIFSRQGQAGAWGNLKVIATRTWLREARA